MSSLGYRKGKGQEKEFWKEGREECGLILATLKEVLVNKLINVTKELHDIKEEFRKVDSQLTQIENKFTGFEKIIVQAQKDIRGVQDEVSIQLGIGGDLSQLEEDFDDLQQMVENLDNNSRKNNLRLKGVKEYRRYSSNSFQKSYSLCGCRL